MWQGSAVPKSAANEVVDSVKLNDCEVLKKQYWVLMELLRVSKCSSFAFPACGFHLKLEKKFRLIELGRG